MELLQGFRNEAAPLPSATVVLLRDGPDGLEVFLLQRHAQSEVLGGAYVFPGGKVDVDDADWQDRIDVPAAKLRARLGEPELDERQAAALYVCAMREVFEETGLLLAPIDGARARAAWQALRGGRGFGELLRPWDLRLAVDLLQPWSRWVTPVASSVSRKRFDTRFFVAIVPAGQQPSHDDHEATSSLWLAPRAALRQYWEGGIELAPPQIMSLAHLARHADVAGVLAAARAAPPPCIRPEPFDQDGERLLCYPGDPLHSMRQQLLPGPTRLRWRNKRFEPDGGLPMLLGD
ncbi:MAG: hydrolase [Ramlibacter sp.]|jgi:8-oxo-dGTP pyrophosphatase MutT (NUDIX family)|uniref:NUDIX hydrolase n=1 Tax=Ramlibacter sp. TaxID=1917967 RepID=UPI002617E651|nr:NUDIX hydrolase [Ramlibacter sp.]MDB5753051.1 hydrolase [Ramlibacter sp.]